MATSAKDLDKSSSSTFSEEQYNDDDDMLTPTDRQHSVTPKVGAIPSLKHAMRSVINLNKSADSFQKCDVVRAAIHHLGDLFCEFNDNISKHSTNTKNSSNLSYKEHENESMDAHTFVTFIEDKFALYGYTSTETNQLFTLLQPQSPNTPHSHHKLLTIHFTEFNPIIHQFYTTKFTHSKATYAKHDIAQLLLHSIQSKLQTIKNIYNNNDIPLQSPKISMDTSPIGISNSMMLNIVDTPISNDTDLRTPDASTQSYEDTPTDTDSHSTATTDMDTDDDYDIDDIMQEIENEIHDQMNVGTHIGFGDSGLYMECVDGKAQYDMYQFYAPHTLFQDSGTTAAVGQKFNPLYQYSPSLTATTCNGNASPLSLLSSKPKSTTAAGRGTQNGVENPFKFTFYNSDAVYKRQRYLYQYAQFFGGGNVYLTTQQLQFVDINPMLPSFIASHDQPEPFNMTLYDEAITPYKPRNRSGNIHDVAARNTEIHNGGKVSENTDLYDEDKKLAALLQSLVHTIHYAFVPNGLLTHFQFIEFIDSLQIYNYDEYVLKHMFRYIYTDELPPTLPPPPIIPFDDNEPDNYNNVNGMYVAYSECIGYEYDEVLDLIKQPINHNFDDLLTTMVVERLQTIYQTLKFDDLDAHPNQFLHRQNSMALHTQNDKLNADELKENVFNFFDENQHVQVQVEVDTEPQEHEHEQHDTHRNSAISTMRSTESHTLTYNGLFRQSIISADSLNNLLINLKKEKKDKNTVPKLVTAASTSTTTMTHYNHTPITPYTTTTTQTSFDKYPALIDINDIPASYHHRIQSLQSKLMKKGSSLNALVDYDDKSSDTHTQNTHKSPSSLEIEEKDVVSKEQPEFMTNDSSVEIEIVSPDSRQMKRKKRETKRQHSVSRQPSLPTLPEEHMDSINNTIHSNKETLVHSIVGDIDIDIDGKVDQLFATIGSDQVHIDLLKYGLKLIEISFNKYEEEHYFLRVLQSYGKHNDHNNSPRRFFVHKNWIKQFLYDDDIPHNLRELQDKMITNLQRKSHLLANELSRRSSYVTNSSYQFSSDGNNRRYNTGMSKELQQTYVSYFKQTLNSRTKALTQYTQTRYTPTHQKYWRDIFLFMSKGEKYLDRKSFKAGIERCGIKIRTGNKYKKKKKNREIEQILNAVFVEMDFEHAGYITVHKFTAMMMSKDPQILSSNSTGNSSGYFPKYSNTNTLTVPTTSDNRHYHYYQAPPAQQYYHGNVQHYQRNNMHEYAQNERGHQKHRKHKHNTRRYQTDKYQHVQLQTANSNVNQFENFSFSSNGPAPQQMYYAATPEVEEKIHQNYLNNEWNSYNNNNVRYNEEEQDEKIPMLEVLNTHEINMQNGSKKKKNFKKKKVKKKKVKSNAYNSKSKPFVVRRKRLTSLDLIERRYYLRIDGERKRVILSGLEAHSEISMEFGLHQIIDGDHQSTTIQIKTVNGKHIYYEFEVRQSKDEFVDLLDEVKHEHKQKQELDRDDVLPRGTGLVYDDNENEEDVDPVYDDECSICVSKLCTLSTVCCFLFLSLFNGIAIYIYYTYENARDDILLIWILINMLFLRISAVESVGSKLTLTFSKVFDCHCCHELFFYGFSTHSLITIWTIVWLLWNTLIIGVDIWDNDRYDSDRNILSGMEVAAFTFMILSVTFLTFAQFAYCRCRCCSVTLSELLHTVLQRLSCCFIAIYGILYSYSQSYADDIFDIFMYPSFWLSIILIFDFIFYSIYICILQQHNTKINAVNINVRVISQELCELQFPFKIKPFSYIWLSDDRATWIKLPILLTTDNNNLTSNNNQNNKRNVEENPYHHQENSSNEAIEQTITDMYKLKHALYGTKNQYEAVAQGLYAKNENIDYNLCSVVIHSRNRMGQRIIHKASHCFEQANFNLFMKKYNFPLTIMCFAFVKKQIGIIATDDRIIPAISYIFNKQQQHNQYIEILWIVNSPKKQYLNLYQLLNLFKNQTKAKSNIKIVDMTKKKSSKEKQISIFLNSTSAQAIFALTSRYTGRFIKKQSKNAAVYIQHTEWY